MNKHCVHQLNAFLELQHVNDIIEITYAYEPIETNHFFNKTIFEDFAGIQRKQWKEKKYDYHTIHTIVKRKLEAVIAGLGDFSKENHFENINDDYRYLIDKAITYMQKILSLAIQGLPFEIEKTGMKIPLTQTQIHERIHAMRDLEKELFDGECKDKQFEVNESYILLEKLGRLYKERITSGQYQKYLQYIQQIKALPTFSLTQKQQEEKLETLQLTGIFHQHTKLFHTKIPRDVYTRIFSLALKVYDIHKPIIVDERSSIYDGAKALYIPQSHTYDQLSLSRVITLIGHEIETHYLIEKNHRKLFDEIRGGRNLAKEEGLAIIHEWLIKEKNIKKFTVTRGIALTLMGELLPSEQLQEFLEIYYTMHKKDAKKTTIMKLLRMKRNFPFHSEKGCQHKDVTYSRGAIKTVEYFYDTTTKYEDLYISKVDFGDIMAAKHIMQAEKVRIHHPKFLAERIKLSLLGKNYTNQEFREYLQDTYPFLQKDEVQAIHTLSPAQQKYYEKIVALFIQCLKEKEEIKQ